MDQYMETNLDGLYYRTSARPGACGPYRTASNYNNCSFDQARKIEAPSRTDYAIAEKDKTILPGTILPAGLIPKDRILASGVILSAGTIIPKGTLLPAGLEIEGITLETDEILPSDFTMSNSNTLNREISTFISTENFVNFNNRKSCCGR